MVIKRGSYQFRGVKPGTDPLEFNESVVVERANMMLANIIIDLGQHTLTFKRGNFRGLRINGVKLDPLSPPGGVTILGGAFDQTYVHEFCRTRTDIVAVSKALAPGAKLAADSFAAAVKIVRREGAGLTEAQFLTFYDVDDDGLLGPKKLLLTIQAALEIGSYIEFRAWALARTPNELRGDQTEVYETIGAE